MNFNSSRAGQWDNSQGYVGISNPVYGTLTFGRTNSLSLDVLTAYDPVASAAFSLIGFSSSFAGFGAGSTVRTNTGFTYRLTYQNYRFAAQAQVGGYDWGNPPTGSFRLRSARTSAIYRWTASSAGRRTPRFYRASPAVRRPNMTSIRS